MVSLVFCATAVAIWVMAHSKFLLAGIRQVVTVCVVSGDVQRDYHQQAGQLIPWQLQ
jgi:hypothetical protein